MDLFIFRILDILRLNLFKINKHTVTEDAKP